MKRALILASVASMIDQFNMRNIALLQEKGYEVHVAANFEFGNTCDDARIKVLQGNLEALGVTWFQVDFARNALNFVQNSKAYRQVKILLKNGYDLIHCHSPIGGVVTRLAAQKYRKKGTTIFYTAHGFHFYDGAPLLNWLIYYPIERLLSRYTDVLITINQEDYARAQSKFHARKTVYVPGVGVDTERFTVSLTAEEKTKMREEMGVPSYACMLISVGELNENKNHRVIVQAMGQLQNPHLHFCIAGRGICEEELVTLARSLGVEQQLHLLGYRDDIPALYAAADIFCFPSIREGLGLAALEAMVAQLPVVAGDNRGTRSYVRENENGYLCQSQDVVAFAAAIEKLAESPALCGRMGQVGKETAREFSEERVVEIMRGLY